MTRCDKCKSSARCLECIERDGLTKIRDAGERGALAIHTLRLAAESARDAD